MKKNSYVGLWLLISVALIIIVALSFIQDITFFDHTFKKAPIADHLLKTELENDSVFDAVDPDSVARALEKKPVETDSTPQSIMIIGDSMTFNLALRIAQYARQNGHTINSVNWDSSNTKIWAEHDTLQHYINKFHPTFIFISLGSNELYFRNPESRRPYVEKILSVIDTIPYIWIGPPNWKEDTGINDMLASVCRPGSFFKSEGIQLARKKDKIHPTREASAIWVDSIMRWMPKSSHPILAEVPADSIKKSNPHIVFLKALNK